MRALFIHDNKFYKYKNEYYSLGAFSYESLWRRYLNYFDEIIVGGRVIKSETYGEITNMIRASGERISFIGFPDLLSVKGIKYFRKTYIELYSELKNVDCAIIRMPSILGLIAIRACKELNKKFICEVVGCVFDSFWNYGNIIGKLIAIPMYYLTRVSISKSHNTIYVSEKFLQKRYPNNYGNNVACSDVSLIKMDDKILTSRINNIESINKKIIIGTLANINVKYKGQQYVIKALYRLKEKGYKFEYQLVGEGDDEYLRTIINKYNLENEVKLIGALPHEEVFSWLDGIDIYIQPSLVEGFPRSVVEAMSRGCPVVGTNVGGITEIVDKKYLFNKKDIRGISRVLIKMDKENMKIEAERSFNVAKKYELSILDKKRNEFYKEFIKEVG